MSPPSDSEGSSGILERWRGGDSEISKLQCQIVTLLSRQNLFSRKNRPARYKVGNDREEIEAVI